MMDVDVELLLLCSALLLLVFSLAEVIALLLLFSFSFATSSVTVSTNVVVFGASVVVGCGVETCSPVVVPTSTTGVFIVGVSLSLLLSVLLAVWLLLLFVESGDDDVMVEY